MQSMKTQQNN